MPRWWGRSAELLAACEAMHYALVALHIRIQTAAAYARLGKPETAHTWLQKALSDAGPDGLVMPFAENYSLLKPFAGTGNAIRFLPRGITAIGEAAQARGAERLRPEAFRALTARGI